MTTNPDHIGRWRKSTYSAEQGACVEVKVTNAAVGVRDTKNPAATLSFSTTAWAAFIRGFKR